MLIRPNSEKSSCPSDLRLSIETSVQEKIRYIPDLPEELDIPVSLEERGEHFTAKLHTGIGFSREERKALDVELSKLDRLGELVFYNPDFTETHDLLVTRDFFGETLSDIYKKELSVTAYLKIALAICEEGQRLLQAGYLHCHLKPEFISYNAGTQQAHFNNLIYCHPLATRTQRLDLPYLTHFNPDLRFYVESPELIGEEYSPYADPELLEKDGRSGGYIYTEKRYLIFTLGMILAQLGKMAREMRYDHYGHSFYKLVRQNKDGNERVTPADASTIFFIELNKQLANMTSITYSERPTIESCVQFFKHQLKNHLGQPTGDLPITLATHLFGSNISKQKQAYSDPIGRRQLSLFHYQASGRSPIEITEVRVNQAKING